MTTNTTPPVKYITRPKPTPHTWGCDHCTTTIVLYVRPTEVTHRCRRTRKVARLTERK